MIARATTRSSISTFPRLADSQAPCLSTSALIQRRLNSTWGDFPTVYVARLLRYVAAQTEQSPHVEFNLLWIKALVDKHGAWLSANRGKVDIELRVVARAITKMKDEIRRLADENVYMVDYLLGQASEDKEPVSNTQTLEWELGAVG